MLNRDVRARGSRRAVVYALVSVLAAGMFLAPGGTSAANAETTSPPANAAGTYENGSPAITWEGGWSTVASGYDSGGSHARMDSVGGATLQFTGTGVQWTARTNGYAGIADVYLDDVKVKSVDLYSPSAAYRAIVFDSGDLKPGDHTIRIERTGTKNAASTGTNIFLDSLVVSNAPVLSGTYENGAAPIVMTGAWLTVTSGYDSGGSHTRIDAAGSADLRFSGTSVRWISRTNSYAGIASVYIDGTLAQTVDLYSATAAYKAVVFDSGPLTRGEHTIRIERSGTRNPSSTGSNLFLDSIVVDDAPVDVGIHEDGDPALTMTGAWSTVTSGYDSGGTYGRLGGTGSAQLKFMGTSIQWLSRTNDYAGIAAVYLDGAKVATVDLYSAAMTYRTVVFDSGPLTPGVHTFRVEHTGTRNSASTGGSIFLDSMIVDNIAVEAGTHENGSESIVLDGPWYTVTSGSDSAGSHDRLDALGTAELRFLGTTVRWMARTNSYAGMAHVFIDGAKVATVDLYSASARYRTVVFDSGPLTRGEHTIRIERSGGKNPASTGSNIYLDSLVVEDTPVEAGIHENGSPSIVTSGTWSTITSGYDSGGSYGRLGGIGDAQLKFVGTGVQWISRTNDYAGIATVYLDGVKVATVDLYSATTTYRTVVYDSGVLTPGVHTIRVERTGTRNPASTGGSIFLDSLVVANTPVVEGTYEDGAAPIILNGPWSTTLSDSDGGGSHGRLDAYGSAELRFAGTGVRWVARTNSYAGIATVYVDDVKVASVDLYSPSATFQTVVFDSGPLERGEHTIRIERAGTRNAGSTGSNIFLDNLVVLDAAVGSGTHEDGSPAIARSGTWSTVSSGSDSGGSHGRLNSAGSAQLKFTGTSVKWVSRTNDYAGIGTVYIDGLKVGSVDLYSASPVYQAVVFESDVLDAGEHTIRIELSGERNSASSGSSVFLDAFVVTDFVSASSLTTVPASGTYDSESGLLTYDRSWRTVESTADLDGSYRVSADGLSSVRFDFEGTGIRWVTRTNHYSGIGKVYIDGHSVRLVDLYSSTRRDQQVVFELTGLTHGTHSIVVERTGTKNVNSTGSEISVDGFIVLDSTAPDSPAAPRIAPERKGLLVRWDPVTAPDVTAYRLYRADPAGEHTLLQEFTPADVSMLDVGLDPDSTHSYRVTAVDSSGNESAPSAATSASTVAAPVVSQGRYANCPTATVTVTSNRELASALGAAKAGDVIAVAPGSYGANFDISAAGTADQPIWICGSRDAVFDAGSFTSGYGFQMTSSSHVILTGMTIRNVKKGVMVVNSSAITVSDIALSDIGEEAVHLRTNTTDSFVLANTIHRTGLYTPEYGEGIYIGSDPSNWCTFSDCLPDRSNRNSVLSNVITATTVEGIEAKSGTEQGWIASNTIDGALLDTRYALSWISVSGNDYIVEGNSGTNSPEDGIKSVEVATVEGWGRNNVFVGNSAADVNPAFYGVRITTPGTGAIVGCDNTLTGTGFGVTNVSCQK
ncbi:right-handed parallel beta-helix repeat-containing protein [Planctomonas psychrotolerans]|uniref:right-handed parallel beta-helix repeat-containing protein n=1 Tax=Planctomonas psychrotolerans TaxID=2528712 RepID=UPI00123A05C5|nr:right-handed parallel beta-helix repeat-containing protein [Planctomonas psychrotolerans]